MSDRDDPLYKELTYLLGSLEFIYKEVAQTCSIEEFDILKRTIRHANMAMDRRVHKAFQQHMKESKDE